MISAGILLLVLTAFGVGVLMFSYLTRRLRRLTGDVLAFTDGSLETDDPRPTHGQTVDSTRRNPA